MSQPNELSQSDIARLMGNEPIAGQMGVVAKLSAHFNDAHDQSFTEEQNALATDIIRLLLNKAEVQVRSMIASNLKSSDKIPPEIALKMARDVAEVALPVIQYSKMLSDSDLMDIIKTADDQEKLLAIAGREVVSENIADALVETRIEKVVSTLVQNEGAKINDKTFDKILVNHAESAVVMESMLDRGSLPVALVEKLVAQVSGTLRQTLEAKCGNLDELMEVRKMFDRSMELTSLKFMGLKTTDSEMTRMINHLEKHGKLQPFSALCMANLQFFEVSLSRILHIPYVNVHQLLQDPNGLKALYHKAELPESMFEAVELCIQSIQALENEEAQADKKPILSPFKVIDRMRNMSAGRDIEGLDYMLGMLQQQTRENLRHQINT